MKSIYDIEGISDLCFIALEYDSCKWYEVEYNFLEFMMFGTNEFNYGDVDEFIENYTYDEAIKVMQAMTNHKYEVQHFIVSYDTGTPVEIEVDVYHDSQELLTIKEILDESEGYMEDIGISVVNNSVANITARLIVV